MLSGPSFRSVFVFSINSLIFSGFSLTSFHLAEASLSAFSWLYTLRCAVVRKSHGVSFIYNYSYFYYSFCKSTYFICTTWKHKQTMEQQPNRACEGKKSKQKQNHASHSNWPRALLFNSAHKKCNGIIKGWLHCLTSESKERFLVNNILKFGSAWCLVTAQIQFSLIKEIKIGRPEHLLTPTPLRQITSHFCLSTFCHPANN